MQYSNRMKGRPAVVSEHCLRPTHREMGGQQRRRKCRNFEGVLPLTMNEIAPTRKEVPATKPHALYLSEIMAAAKVATIRGSSSVLPVRSIVEPQPL
jgi:hypothetical protein